MADNTRLTPDDELDAEQLAAMQAMDDALRAGEICRACTPAIERAVREGHVPGARKRLTRARQRHDRSIEI